MTKKNGPPNGEKTRFKKGVSPNPGGKRKLPEDIKKARALNQIELERVCNKQLWMTRDELKDLMKDPAANMLELTVASILGQAMQKGDQQRLEWIAMRLIGRVSDRIEVTSTQPFAVKLLEGAVIELGTKTVEGSN